MSEDQIDWRQLLIMYMAHVLAEEGVTFCPSLRTAGWSNEEVEAMESVEVEVIQSAATGGGLGRSIRPPRRARWSLGDPPDA